NNGKWNTTTVMADTSYLRASVQTSQDINPSYGYLWWLNGKEKSMVPQSQVVFNRPLFLDAPSDMYSALGKNGQILNIVPSQNLVMVRMGNNANNLPVPFFLNDEIWKRFNEIQCTSSVEEEHTTDPYLIAGPNPAYDLLHLSAKTFVSNVRLLNSEGKEVLPIGHLPSEETLTVDVSRLKGGWYWLHYFLPSGKSVSSTVFI